MIMSAGVLAGVHAWAGPQRRAVVDLHALHDSPAGRAGHPARLLFFLQDSDPTKYMHDIPIQFFAVYVAGIFQWYEIL